MENPEICDIRAFDFLDLWEYVCFDRRSKFNYYRKTVARNFDTIRRG